MVIGAGGNNLNRENKANTSMGKIEEEKSEQQIKAEAQKLINEINSLLPEHIKNKKD